MLVEVVGSVMEEEESAMEGVESVMEEVESAMEEEESAMEGVELVEVKAKYSWKQKLLLSTQTKCLKSKTNHP